MSKREASHVILTKKIKTQNGVKTAPDFQSTAVGKLVGGFIVFGTPIQPKHVSRARIAEAIDRLR